MLAGKTALVTGSTSGIGLAVARALAKAGAKVMLNGSRPAADAEALRAELAAEAGVEVGYTAANLADPASARRLVEATIAAFGGVDILINNAGRSIRRPLAESLDRWHDVERTMTLNYYSPLRLVRGFAPGMLARGDGHIINVSTWGVMNESSPLFAVYNASKSALTAVSRVIETEWGASGVHSSTLFYPLVKTPMIAPTRAFDGVPGLSADEAADWMVTAAKTRPVRIAPRIAVTSHALNSFVPGVVDNLMKRRRAEAIG